MFRGLVVLSLLILAFPCFAYSQYQPIPILMYHHIVDNRKGDLYLPAKVFNKHLDFLQQNGYLTVTFNDVLKGRTREKSVVLTFDDGTWTHWWVANELERRGMKGVFFISSGLIDRDPFLSRQKITKMSQMGHEIGSHSVSHPYLTKIDYAKLFEEVKLSKMSLEELIDRPVISFAYPFGEYNKEVIRWVEKAGYHYARTTDEGISIWGQEKNFRLKIIYIHSNTIDLKLR